MALSDNEIRLECLRLALAQSPASDDAMMTAGKFADFVLMSTMSRTAADSALMPLPPTAKPAPAPVVLASPPVVPPAVAPVAAAPVMS
jgi:hypothetical protein